MIGKKNIARLTAEYILEHPSIADCIDRGLVNYSALAREIAEAQDIASADAIIVACRRFRSKRKKKLQHERKILNLLRKVKFRLRNRICVVILEKSKVAQRIAALQSRIKAQRGDYNLIEGEDVYTLITNEEFLPLIHETQSSGILKATQNLVQISLAFDESLETVSGVLAYLYRLFAERGINIREEMSCWTEVLIVIDEEDAAAAMAFLGKLTK